MHRKPGYLTSHFLWTLICKKGSGLPYYDLKYIACVGENQSVSRLVLVR